MIQKKLCWLLTSFLCFSCFCAETTIDAGAQNRLAKKKESLRKLGIELKVTKANKIIITRDLRSYYIHSHLPGEEYSKKADKEIQGPSMSGFRLTLSIHPGTFDTPRLLPKKVMMSVKAKKALYWYVFHALIPAGTDGRYS